MGAGPVTDTLGRPSQSVLENWTATEAKHRIPSLRVRRRRAVASLHNAEMHLLIARQRAARRAIAQAVDAGLSARHTSAVAAVVSKFANLRAMLAQGDEQIRAAGLQRISSDEAHELARLALEHAAEKRSHRHATLAPLYLAHGRERRELRRRSRHHRIVLAVQFKLRGQRNAASKARHAVRRASTTLRTTQT